MIEEAIKKISQGSDLSKSQMYDALQEIMTGKVTTPEIVSFLTALNKKGESVEELTAAVQIMRRYVTKINTKNKVILDTCGTGGDRKGTFNISTVVAFVASGCGVAVAKHGNRSVSSLCGSADTLEALGININMLPEKLGECLDQVGIAFLFAQSLHPAMKYAMPARKEIGDKTMFNILGPLSNPADATHQLVGVYDRRWTEPLARVLLNLASVHALVVCGDDGLDEITTTGLTWVCELHKGEINNYQIDPQELGFKKAKSEDLAGGSPAQNCRILLDILNGKPGAERDIVVLNAAAALYAAGRAESIREGVKFACESIDSGKALGKLESLKEYSLKNS